MSNLDITALLKEICDWYQHDVVFDNSAVTCISECGEVFAFDTINQALLGWVPTLEASNKDLEEKGQDCLWTLEEINFIKESVSC